MAPLQVPPHVQSQVALLRSRSGAGSFRAVARGHLDVWAGARRPRYRLGLEELRCGLPAWNCGHSASHFRRLGALLRHHHRNAAARLSEQSPRGLLHDGSSRNARGCALGARFGPLWIFHLPMGRGRLRPAGRSDGSSFGRGRTEHHDRGCADRLLGVPVRHPGHSSIGAKPRPGAGRRLLDREFADQWKLHSRKRRRSRNAVHPVASGGWHCGDRPRSPRRAAASRTRFPHRPLPKLRASSLSAIGFFPPIPTC